MMKTLGPLGRINRLEYYSAAKTDTRNDSFSRIRL